MPLDTFICGTCMVSFNDIHEFILHKNDNCGKPAEAAVSEEMPVSDQTQAEVTTVVDNIGHLPDLDMVQESPEEEQQAVISAAVCLPGSEALLSNAAEIFQQGGNGQTVIILQGDLPSLNMDAAHLLEVDRTFNTELLAGMYKKRGRPPGRPKKNKEKQAPLEKKHIPEKEPDIGPDGKMTCRRCKKVFSRERVFNAHRCIALSEYVDFTTKDVPDVDPDDNDLPQDDLEDEGALDPDYKDAEYKLPSSLRLDDDKKMLNKFFVPVEAADVQGQNAAERVEGHNGVSEGQVGGATEGGQDVDPDAALMEAAQHAEEGTDGKDREGKGIPVEVLQGPDIEESGREKKGNPPQFGSEEEKAQFEASLNVDLSGLDNMFRTHAIEQELNDNVQTSRFSQSELTLFSCNLCDKVFKSLSHMRTHVLTHTDLKPYKCFKCNYVSNSRGNLYTHMRKHTGQFYHCSHCKFHSVNRSHVREHMLTHTSQKQPCALCNRMYNTVKSLMSHIRKYHDNNKGREYLGTFQQSRELRGTTVIHQCHVCNRKFKKKADRDRHLFVHDIKDMAIVQHCQLCSYSASRIKYLEKHFQKHRCIYRCCRCDEMFLSTVRLVEHLTTTHTETGDPFTWEELFEESIAASLYLPEPDNKMSPDEKAVDNLPDELSVAAIEREERLQNSGENYLPFSAADLYINKELEIQGLGDEILGVSEGQREDTLAVEGVEAMDTVAEDTEMAVENIENNADDLVEHHDDQSLSEEVSNKVETNNVEDNNEDSCEKMDTHETALGNPSSIDVIKADDPSAIQDENSVEIDKEEQDNSAVVEETNLTEEDLLGDTNSLAKPRASAKRLIDKLGYKTMTLRIFQKMRDTFGSEECEYCGRLFFSRMDYETHVRTHTGDKPFVCTKCGFRSITKDNLRRHVEKEHENITYPCRDCAYVAYTRTQLWNHAMKHRGLKGLECPSCREQFETMTELKEHADQIHPNANIEELDKLLSSRHKIQGKIGRRTYKCPHCDKVFLRASSELQKHMWIHEGIKPFKCPLCPYACRSKNNLQAHMLRHSKDKPFQCGDCGKAYKSKTALRWHVRSHTGGKAFKCDRCPYEAVQASHLKRHMETHDVIKKFVCGECQFSANTLGFLKVHYARFHKHIDTSNLPTVAMAPVQPPGSEVNAFKCLSCDYLFGNLSDLKRHLKTRHHFNPKELANIISDEQENNGIQEVLFVMEDKTDSSQQPVAMEIITDPALDIEGSTVEVRQSSVATLLNVLMDGQPGDPNAVSPTSLGTVSQENIIVENEGQPVFVSSDGITGTTEIDGNQYVICIPQEGVDGIGMIEVQGEEVETESVPAIEMPPVLS
ncbi:zinc finger protein ZFAT-like [Mya arenaria]|uniref:zinc finger protein ZFAT-like n=1 Tax=Mya arenaria TaxID=6604 RepID=UPI0022E3CC62|nr:zinc finger protein ZFAT-like [Mya arenaria]XP_052818728.1 zinc finger protein ZFAT-like [Mya arenaria]XP_052818729.1 zinc finger protein ZFAT-like [Mya arenaria]XP_052818730.1 zinc finger protein ZFAT-like [Mya arenaria]